ncbi:serine threonine- phosphatase 4 regulatory subunit 4-like [Paramuricea clavata]|uniref:Serine threonine- phosphatase 4 regulatory subunit 4-like n=1 Tax=Paramuricea clavata TaxID=317549 RepID=A0A7D9HCD2_PARCT|nr:serine threonine- phosphatase 4 regulatory subunit 4-like [Paramuricea clavata]
MLKLAISRGWLNALLCTIPQLPKDAIKREILPLAITKGQLSQSVASRLSCCQIIGQVATKFEPFWIKKELLGLVTSLCQDVDYEVRACMCNELESIARALGGELTKAFIISELMELTNDEECTVRLAAIETVANLLQLLDDEICVKVIIPLVQNFCDSAHKKNNETLVTVSQLFGKLSYGLNVNLTESQKKWFVEYFQKLCSSGLTETKNKVNHFQRFNAFNESLEETRCTEIRRNCAFNFPAMVLFVGPENFTKELASCFHALVTDRKSVVRRTISCGFHEIIKLLGSSVHCLQPELHILLMDESFQVLEGVISNLNIVLTALSNGGRSSLPESKLNNLSELIPPVITCEHTVSQSNNWRVHEQLLGKFASFVKCFTSDQIYYKFVPVLFDVLHRNHVLPVTHAAAYTLCIFIKNNTRSEQRDELCCRFIEDCGKGRSYRHRLLFIKICIYILEIFSRKFFKEHFFVFALELAMDPVVNIRLQFCNLLPKLKSVLKLPVDRGLLQRLEQCVRQLLSEEQDPDVSTAVREAVLKLDKIEVVMETLSRRSMFEEDLVDQKKEEEEAQMEERERSGLSLARHGSDGKKKNPSKDDKTNKKVGTVNSKKYGHGKQELKKTTSKEGKTCGSKSSGSKNLHVQSTNSGLTKMSSMTSALPDLASCSYLSENSTGTSSKKVTSGPSLVTVKSSHSSMTHKSTTSKKSHSIPGSSKPTTKVIRSQPASKR